MSFNLLIIETSFFKRPWPFLKKIDVVVEKTLFLRKVSDVYKSRQDRQWQLDLSNKGFKTIKGQEAIGENERFHRALCKPIPPPPPPDQITTCHPFTVNFDTLSATVKIKHHPLYAAGAWRWLVWCFWDVRYEYCVV